MQSSDFLTLNDLLSVIFLWVQYLVKMLKVASFWIFRAWAFYSLFSSFMLLPFSISLKVHQNFPSFEPIYLQHFLKERLWNVAVLFSSKFTVNSQDKNAINSGNIKIENKEYKKLSDIVRKCKKNLVKSNWIKFGPEIKGFQIKAAASN